MLPFLIRFHEFPRKTLSYDKRYYFSFKIVRSFFYWHQLPGLLFITSRRLPYLEDVGNMQSKYCPNLKSQTPFRVAEWQPSYHCA